MMRDYQKKEAKLLQLTYVLRTTETITICPSKGSQFPPPLNQSIPSQSPSLFLQNNSLSSPLTSLWVTKRDISNQHSKSKPPFFYTKTYSMKEPHIRSFHPFSPFLPRASRTLHYTSLSYLCCMCHATSR
jgi:hypothetical protein